MSRSPFLLALLLCLAARVLAQAPPIPLPPAARPPTPPFLAPAADPAAPAPVPGSPGGEPTTPLQFLDSDIKDVLALYEKWTGRRLIYNTQLTGPIRISITGQVPQSEAIKLVEMTLLMNGFNILPTEDPKIWKVTGVGMNPKSAGIPFVDREDLLPANEQTVMFLFKLTWADPTELAATLQSGILAPSQSGATGVTPLPKAQALLVTENTNIIRTLIRIVRAIDVEPAEVVSEFITLQHAEAEEVATALEKLFEKQQTQSTSSPVPGGTPQSRVQRATTDPMGAPLPPGSSVSDGNLSIQITGGPGGLGPTEDNFVVGKVRITADKRTNRLHVVSRPVNMKLIRALIKEYDSEVTLAVPAVRALRFRPVEEVIDAVVATIADPGIRTQGGGTGTGALGGTQNRANPLQNQTTNQNTGSNRFGTDTSGSSGSSALGESLSTSERDTTPVTQQVGKSTIIADKRANSIIVVGTKDVVEKVFNVLDKLDTPQAQVMIHTIIGELRLTSDEQFGLEAILRNGGLLAGGTGGTIARFTENGAAVIDFNNLLNQQNVTRILAAGSGGISGFVTASNDIAAVIRALESSNRFRVTTRPSIFTTNNKRAVITSGEEVPVPTNITSGFGGGTGNTLQTQSSVQFKPIELRLEVLPLINSDREVSLEIVQNISERAGSTRIDNNDIPNISRRALKTYVTVPNNGTLILGGLIKETLDRNRSGINKLVNIPVIGPLFGSVSKNLARNELIIIMRPVVTVHPKENVQLREKTMDAFNLPPDLEAAILPQNIRQHVKPEKTGASPAMRGSAPRLRSESGMRR